MDLLGYITIMIIPVTSFILGILFTVKPVTKINNLAGHRTKYSKLSQQTWDYAQRRMAKTYLIVGAVYTIISAIVNIILFKHGIKVDNANLVLRKLSKQIQEPLALIDALLIKIDQTCNYRYNWSQVRDSMVRRIPENQMDMLEQFLERQ